MPLFDFIFIVNKSDLFEGVRTKRLLSTKGLKIEIMPSNHSVENSLSFRIKTGDETLKIRPKMPREC